MKIAKFISLVKERPVLYDLLNPLYKDRKAKEQMWREVSTAMNIHSDVAKRRWKSLKDCYTKYLKSTMATGPTAYLKYVNWQWAEHMEFVKPHIKFGLIMSNIEIQDNQEIDDLAIRSTSDAQGCRSSSGLLETHERRITSESSGTPESSGMLESSGTCEKTEMPTKFRTYEESKTEERFRKHQRTFENIKKQRRATRLSSADINTSPTNETIFHYLGNKKPQDYSATELIFLGYAKSIKTFSIRRQAQAKMRIAEIMMEEEIANFEETMSDNEFQRHKF